MINIAQILEETWKPYIDSLAELTLMTSGVCWMRSVEPVSLTVEAGVCTAAGALEGVGAGVHLGVCAGVDAVSDGGTGSGSGATSALVLASVSWRRRMTSRSLDWVPLPAPLSTSSWAKLSMLSRILRSRAPSSSSVASTPVSEGLVTEDPDKPATGRSLATELPIKCWGEPVCWAQFLSLGGSGGSFCMFWERHSRSISNLSMSSDPPLLTCEVDLGNSLESVLFGKYIWLTIESFLGLNTVPFLPSSWSLSETPPLGSE